MTFLAPTAMLFLLGISIPIFIHFLNKINVKKIEFSSVRYLKSMKKNAIRSVKFKKLILLLLRVGIISALALMLARPVTKGFMPGWLSAEIDSRLLLVIDNSSSMAAQKGAFSLLENAKKTAIDLIGLYDKNMTIDIVQTCPPQILFSGIAADIKYKKNIIKISNSFHPGFWQNNFLISSLGARSLFRVKFDENYTKILIAINPVAPHLSSECIEMLNIKENLHWPDVEEKFLFEENIKFVVQFNGKTRKIIISKKDTTESLLLTKIKEDNKLNEYLNNKDIQKKPKPNNHEI